MYTGLIIDAQSKQLLTWAFKALIPDWENRGYLFRTQHNHPLPHHMTINMGKFDNTLNNKSILGSEGECLATELVIGTDAVAFKVEAALAYCPDEDDLVEIVTMNDKKSHAHITAAIVAGAKPFQANYLFDGTFTPIKTHKFEEPLRVYGYIQES